MSIYLLKDAESRLVKITQISRAYPYASQSSQQPTNAISRLHFIMPAPILDLVPRLRNLCAFTTSTTQRQASSHGCDAWTGPDRIARQ
jgi:hypothetical protein